MAITDEEKKMALALYEKYSDVFDSIYDALKAADAIDHSPSELGTTNVRARGRIAAKVAGKVCDGANVGKLFSKVLKFLVDKGHLQKLPLPWGPTDQRHIVTNEASPTHPSGRPFFYPVKYNGYTIESHYSRERALQVLGELCRKLEISFEAIET